MRNYEERNESGRGNGRFMSTLHIAMGIFYVVIGLLIIYVKYFGAMELPDGFAYVLGSLMIMYGIFRFWRGFTEMKNNSKRDMRKDFPSLHYNTDKD